MRQITRDSIRAFRNGNNFKRGNTEVKVENCFNEQGEYDYVELRLHGNTIAYRISGVVNDIGTPPGLYISTCGWNTVTTRERLNGLPGVHVTKRKDKLFLNGEPWDGQRTKVELWL